MVIFHGRPSDDHGGVLPEIVSDGDRDGSGQLGVLDDLSPGFGGYIVKEALKVSRYDGDRGKSWFFWSQRGNGSEMTLPLDNNRDPIRHAIRKLIATLEPCGMLVQFWAPTKTKEGRTLLTTQFQPFAISQDEKDIFFNNLCQYRMSMSREYNESFYTDAECGEEQLGLPGRVFLHQFPEFTSDLENYSEKEYPQRKLALTFELSESWAMPVFEHSSHTCIGVLEIVSCFCLHQFLGRFIFGHVYDIFQEFGLQCADKHFQMQFGSVNGACISAYMELGEVLETVCNFYDLSAQAWVSCSACTDLLPLMQLFEDEDNALAVFNKGSTFYHLRKEGVVGMVLSSPYMLYCSDITKLSVSEYPLVPYVRKCEFRGWFVVCLQSSYTANDIYVLEFFLPNRTGNCHHLSLILEMMEENFRTFQLVSRLKLGDLYSFEVMDFQNGRKLCPIQKIQVKQARAKDHNRKRPARAYKKIGVPIEVSIDDILGCLGMKSQAAADKLGVSLSTFKRICRRFGIVRWSCRNPQMASDLPPNDGSAGIFLNNTKGFQEADMVIVWAKFEGNQIKIPLSLSSTLAELQREIHKRLSLMARTYRIKYIDVEDEEHGLTLIACDEDLKGCMHTLRSAGHSSIVVLLERKETLTNFSGLPRGQQTLISPFRGQGPQNVEVEPSVVPSMHSRGGDWLDDHLSYIPTTDEEEEINRCLKDGSYWGEFAHGRWISNFLVIEYSKMLGQYLSHCHFFDSTIIDFKNWGWLDNIKLPKTEKIFFPVLRNNHWMLMVIDVKKKCFLWLDSLRLENEKENAEELARTLNEKFVSEKLAKQNGWPIEYPEDTPIQENGNKREECAGPYVLSSREGLLYLNVLWLIKSRGVKCSVPAVSGPNMFCVVCVVPFYLIVPSCFCQPCFMQCRVFIIYRAVTYQPTYLMYWVVPCLLTCLIVYEFQVCRSGPFK